MMNSRDIKELLLYGESIHLECKECRVDTPKSVWETYSAFANTYGGIILLGIHEDRNEQVFDKRFSITGVTSPTRTITNFWNTLNSDEKVNANLLKDENVYIVEVDGKSVVVVEVPQADYRQKPVYINGNPLKGSFKRSYEGDYHCTDDEVKAMLRDANEQGCDGLLLEDYTMDDIDLPTLHAYRNEFQVRNPSHVFNRYDDKEFLKNMGGYAVNRKSKQEGLTLAGLMVFGKGLSIKERFDNIRMDYIDKTHLAEGQRWSDRFTYDGTWENNLYNFFHKVVDKLTADIPRPFSMKGIARENDTPVHMAIREAVTNMIIHADYMITGVLRVEKFDNHLYLSNPGSLRLPVDMIYTGNHTAARNPKIQDIFRMIGYGENIGSGFPTILDACKQEQWRKPDLKEVQETRTVDLKIWMVSLMPADITAKLCTLYGDEFPRLNGIEKRVLATAMLEDEVDNDTIQTLLEINPLDAGHLLSGLVERQFLVQKGKGRWTMYQVNKDYLWGTPQETPQVTPQENISQNANLQIKTQNTPQVTPQETLQVTPQEKSIWVLHQEKRIIQYCEIPRTLNEIKDYLRLKDTNWLRQKYINHLLGKKLWMTIPDSPKNRNQKYTSIPPKE